MTKRGSEDCPLLSSSPSSSSVSDPSLLAPSSIETNNNGLTSNKKVKLEPAESPAATSINTSSSAQEAPSATTTYNPIPTTMNGTASDDLHSMNNNNGNPSRVVHVRNIPPDAHESDLTNLAMPFGKVSNLLFLRGKNQAMIEFVDLSSAQMMVSYWQQHPQPTVRGRSVYCQFSNHQQIKQNENSSSGGGMSSANGYNNNGHGGDESMTETPVLRVVIEQLIYPATVEHFFQLFSRYGKVTKVVTFSKNGQFQALVQFETSSQAATAKQGLDGTSMFAPQNGNNLLRVGFSKLTNLNVRFNNDKSRDFTNPNLPSGGPQSMGGGGGPGGDMGAFAMDPVALAAYAATHPSAAAALSAASLGFPSHANPAAGQGSGHHGHHQSMGGYGGGSGGGGRMGGRNDSNMMSAHSMGGMGFGGVVLLASNLPEQIANPDALFTLFGVFGDVIRVKVLYNKKDNALIQMAESQQANLAVGNLDRLKLFSKTLKVTPSRHGVVQMPKEGQPDAGLTKDYTNSPLHRFKKPGSKNYSNIFPPSTTLHLSNIPATVSEDDLKNIFREISGRPDAVVGFKFFPKDRKMALISMGTLDDAVLALIHGHNYQLAESAHLRVSFSKSNI